MKRVPPETASPNLVFGLYYAFKIVPLLVSAGSIYLGYRLFILGVTGQASLSVDIKSVQGQLLNAAPGLFFAVGGIVIAIITVWKGVQIEFGPPNNRSFLNAPGSFRVDKDDEIAKLAKKGAARLRD